MNLGHYGLMISAPQLLGNEQCSSVFAGAMQGDRWSSVLTTVFLDRHACESEEQSGAPTCVSRLLALRSAETQGGNRLLGAIRTKGSVFLPGITQCQQWTFHPDRCGQPQGQLKSDKQAPVDYVYDPDKDTLELDRGKAPRRGGKKTKSMHAVRHIDKQVVLVGGWPWFYDAAACAAFIHESIPTR